MNILIKCFCDKAKCRATPQKAKFKKETQSPQEKAVNKRQVSNRVGLEHFCSFNDCIIESTEVWKEKLMLIVA